MKGYDSFFDSRMFSFCAYCGGLPTSRDHIPPRAFLEAPFPENLPVVGSCLHCNQGASLDEQYVATLIDCVLAGTTDVQKLGRERTKRTLNQSPALSARLSDARVETPEGDIAFAAEPDRIYRVVRKLGQGHVMFELGNPRIDPPTMCSFYPLISLTGASREGFEAVPQSTLLPEVGSRAMSRLFLGEDNSWISVQPGRYRYVVASGPPLVVRLVISEYLAGEVIWGC